MTRHRDFDAFFAERRQAVEPVTFTLGGEAFVLPGRLPAEVGLLALAARQEGGDNAAVTPEFVRDIMHGLLSDADFVRFQSAVKTSETSVFDLVDIFQWIFEQYQDGVHAMEEADPNPVAPEQPGQKPESSTTGV